MTAWISLRNLLAVAGSSSQIGLEHRTNQLIVDGTDRKLAEDRLGIVLHALAPNACVKPHVQPFDLLSRYRSMQAFQGKRALWSSAMRASA